MRNITFELSDVYLPTYVPDTVYAYKVEPVTDTAGLPMPGHHRITLHHYTLADQTAGATVLDKFLALQAGDADVLPACANSRTQTIPTIPAGDTTPALQYAVLSRDSRGDWTAYAYSNYVLDLLSGLAMSKAAQIEQNQQTDFGKVWSTFQQIKTTKADKNK